jgi:hypothetical protein
MTAASGNNYNVGARKGYVFQLSTAGYPAAAAGGTPVYEGLELTSIKGLDLATPDARRIPHNGNDRVAAVDFLPSLEPVTGQIRISPSLQTLNAALTNVTSFSVGNIKAMPWNTEDQGTESDVAIHVFQQALDASTKLRAYRSLMIPRARAIPVLGGMNDNPGESRYLVVANPSTKQIWGTAMTTVLEGATEAAVIETMSTGRPKLVAWLADTAQVAFTIPTDKPTIDQTATSVAVWVDGVLKTYTGDYTWTSSTVITFGSAPGVGKNVVCWYEY